MALKWRGGDSQDRGRLIEIEAPVEVPVLTLSLYRGRTRDFFKGGLQVLLWPV